MKQPINLTEMTKAGFEMFKMITEAMPEDTPDPMFLFIDPYGRVGVLPVPIRYYDFKAQVASAIKCLLKDKGAIAYVQFTEAWGVNCSPAEYAEMRAAGITPSTSDKRREMIVYSGMDRKGQWVAGEADIIRTADGRKIVGEMKPMKTKSTYDRFGTLLEDEIEN